MKTIYRPELLFDDCATIPTCPVHCHNNIFILFCKNLSCNFYIALVVLFWPDYFGNITKIGNEKDFDFRVRSKGKYDNDSRTQAQCRYAKAA